MATKEPMLDTPPSTLCRWAYLVIDTLLREISANVTFIDLGVRVILGFIAGLAVGLIPAARRSGYLKLYCRVKKISLLVILINPPGA